VYFPGRKIKVDAVIGDYTGKTLGDVSCRECEKGRTITVRPFHGLVRGTHCLTRFTDDTLYKVVLTEEFPEGRRDALRNPLGALVVLNRTSEWGE